MANFLEFARTLEDLPEHVKAERLRHSLSQADAADEMGIGRTTLWRMETGQPVMASSLLAIVNWLHHRSEGPQDQTEGPQDQTAV